jgi:hypothetical protein
MTLFGQRIIATNFIDPPQSYVMGSSALFADLISSGLTSLKGRYAAVVRDWLVFGNTTDGTYGPQPQRVHWSAIDDPTNFPTPATAGAAAVQSDFDDLVGDAGWVQGIVGNLGTADGAVFQERAVVRMVYIGPPAIFAFTPAEGVRGTPAPGSIVQDGALAYYLGEDGFYVFNGSASQPIGVDRVDKTFLADLDQSYFYRIEGAVDPINKQIWWAYPGSGHSGGNPNRIIVYDRARDRWTITDANDVQVETLLRGLTPGYSLDTLDSLSSSIDALTLSLDSRIYTGGRAFMARSTPRTCSAPSPARRWRRRSTRPRRRWAARVGWRRSPTRGRWSTAARLRWRSARAARPRERLRSARPWRWTAAATARSASPAATRGRGSRFPPDRASRTSAAWRSRPRRWFRRGGDEHRQQPRL